MKKSVSQAPSELSAVRERARWGTQVRLWSCGIGLTILVSASGCALFSKKNTTPPVQTSTETQPVAPAPVQETAKPPAPEAQPAGTSATVPGMGTPGPVGESGGTPPATTSRDGSAAFERAVKSINEGPRSYPDALGQLDAVISANPRLAEAHYNKGLVLQRTGELAEAEKAYRKAIELKPTLAEAWLNLSDVYRMQRDYTRAMSILDEGLKASPQNALLMNGRALVLRLMGRNDEATDEVRRILKINANDVNAYNNLGRIYIGQKDYEMARLVFEKALQTVPASKDDPYIHHNFGVAFLGMKDPLAAQREFDQALALKPDLLEALIDRAYLHLEIQEYEKAAELLRRAIAVAPKNVVARLNLGVALRGMKEYDKAQIQYEEALRIDPKNTAVLLNYGILLGDYKERYLEAIDVYKRLKEVTPPGPESERVDKLIKEMELLHKRWLKKQERLQQQKPKEEEKPPTPAAPEGAAPADGAPAGDGARSPAEGAEGAAKPSTPGAPQ